MTYEVTDPTVDSQIIQLKDSGANVFFNIATPKFAAQAIRKAADIGWKPVQYLNNVSLERRVGHEAGRLRERPGHHHGGLPHGSHRQAVGRQCRHEDVARVDGQVHAGRQPQDASNVFAYSVSVLMHETLKKCGDDLTRENVMKQAANFQKFRLPLLLPGITVSTSPTDYYPIQAVQLYALQGRDLGAVRRHHARRKHLIRLAHDKERPPIWRPFSLCPFSSGILR